MEFKIAKFLRLFAFTTFMIMSCKNNEIRKAVPYTKMTAKELQLKNDIIAYKKIIDSESAADTLIANLCDDAPNQEEIIDETLGKKNKSAPKNIKKVHKKNKKKIPCKGQYLDIDQYQHVSLVILNASDSFKIIGRSAHDSYPNYGDFILMKYGENQYAYNLGHICGSIQIGYAKDSININDILHSRIWDSTWHVIGNR